MLEAGSDSKFLVHGDPDALLATLCPIDERGHLLFGFSGRSRTPSDHRQLLAGPVEIIDYLMEGFVPYLLSAERTTEGLRLIVRRLGTNRDWSIDWFVEKHLKSHGHAVSRSPV